MYLLRPPPSVWAQKSDLIALTICLEECKKPVVEIHKDKIYFKGTGGSEKKTYEVDINLYSEINPDESSSNILGRGVEFLLKKKEEGPFWPRLTKEKVKYHWLKLDFHKFNYEKDSDSDENNFSMSDANSVKIGDTVNGPDKEERDEDSDDSDLPDLE
ncbi:Prostaglandin E synthase, putative [Pediculus humanus corporis]|uniref:Prostaglandin E synthase, putative n=1 Tax=Pediculus humanus subsp. corporis TaxID=121224 RepID=E0VXS9_PEDHC|nr:Prostaglandin E synthase, putative [Pediculus humanus corporis]EEB18185.1 Prostaglandin E synthase, putative [Pediculus humanus corporis]